MLVAGSTEAAACVDAILDVRLAPAPALFELIETVLDCGVPRFETKRLKNTTAAASRGSDQQGFTNGGFEQKDEMEVAGNADNYLNKGPRWLSASGTASIARPKAKRNGTVE